MVKTSSIHARDVTGFTLVELMVTLVVGAILVTMAVPSFRETMAAHRAKRTASELQLALVQARSEALKRGSDVQVAASGGVWNSGWSIIQTSDNSVVGRYDPPAGISITASSGLTSVTYRPSGRPPAGSAPLFTVTASGAVPSATKCLQIDLSGMPYYVAPLTSGLCQ